jgi:DNA primase
MAKLPGKTLGSEYSKRLKRRVKKRIDLVSLFASFGVELKNKGKSYTGKCPLHEGDDLTLSVDREKGIYQWFECGETGDAVTLVERLLRLEFQDALTYLRDWPANGNGHEVPVPTITHRVSHIPMPPKRPKSRKRSRFPIRQSKRRSGTPRRFPGRHSLILYLFALRIGGGRGLPEGHGLKDRATGSGSRSATLPENYPKDSRTGRKHILRRKVSSAKVMKVYSGCITVPLYDEQEKVVAFQGYSVSGNREIKNLGSTGFFNRKALSVYRQEIILTETVIDGLSLIELGFQNVFPCYGKNGFTPVHLKALKDEAVKTVVIAFGPEETKAIGKLREKLLKEGFSVKGIFPPLGKSWNEYLVSGGDAETVKSLFFSGRR